MSDDKIIGANGVHEGTHGTEENANSNFSKYGGSEDNALKRNRIYQSTQ